MRKEKNHIKEENKNEKARAHLCIIITTVEAVTDIHS